MKLITRKTTTVHATSAIVWVTARSRSTPTSRADIALDGRLVRKDHVGVRTAFRSGSI